MGIALTIVIIITGIILILLTLALFIPKHYSVVVSETIDRPMQTVRDYVSLLQNQIQYSEWLKTDPDLLPTITGIDGTVGATLKWESHQTDKDKNVGMGEQEIKSVSDHTIDIELRLIKPQTATCKLRNQFAEHDKLRTIYTCTFYAYAKYPVNLPSYVIGKRFIKRAQQKTLQNIKAILESTD